MTIYYIGMFVIGFIALIAALIFEFLERKKHLQVKLEDASKILLTKISEIYTLKRK